jgi:hypothetical protein
MAFIVEVLKTAGEALKAAVASGDVAMLPKVVTVSAKVLKAEGITPDTVKAAGFTLNKDGAIEQPCQIPYARSAKGMSALCGGKLEPATDKPAEGKDERTDEQKAPGVCDYFNYAADLEVRGNVRSAIMSKLESPDKAIAKAVAALEGVGMPKALAVETIVNQMRASGLIPADYAYAG